MSDTVLGLLMYGIGISLISFFTGFQLGNRHAPQYVIHNNAAEGAGRVEINRDGKVIYDSGATPVKPPLPLTR